MITSKETLKDFLLISYFYKKKLYEKLKKCPYHGCLWRVSGGNSSKKKRELKKKTHPGISHFVGIGFFVVGKTSREICWKGI